MSSDSNRLDPKEEKISHKMIDRRVWISRGNVRLGTVLLCGGRLRDDIFELIRVAGHSGRFVVF